MRPGTLIVIITLLAAMVGFAIFLVTYDDGRPEPGRPSPASSSPEPATP